MYEKGTLSVIELKDYLGIQSSSNNKQIIALEEKGYITAETSFINESPKKIIHLNQPGLDKYATLSNILFEFLSR